MITGPLISSILQSPSLNKPHLELFPGQIVRGEILKMLPDQQALVRIGQLNVLAQMETEFSIGQPAWLQVQRAGQPALLKVLTIGDKASKGERSFQDLTKSLGLGDSEENRNIVGRLLQEKLPIQSNEVVKLREWIQREIASLDTIIFAMKKGFPLTEEVLSSLEEFFHGFQAQLIVDLTKDIETMDNGIGMKDALDRFALFMEEIKDTGISLSGEKLQDLLKTMDKMKMDIQMILGLVHSPETEEKLGKLVRFITGQQLLLAPSTSPIQQWLIHLPLIENNNSFVQIESQKQPNGKIDSENCRLLFYLDLVSLGSMTVDVTIMNKIVSIDLKNDYPEMVSLSHLFRDDLKQALKNAGYTLSGLKVEANNDNKPKTPQKWVSPYKGVDFRV